MEGALEDIDKRLAGSRGGDRMQEEMAQTAGLSSRVRWTEYEAGTRRPHWALWELLLLRLDQHPHARLVKR